MLALEAAGATAMAASDNPFLTGRWKNMMPCHNFLQLKYLNYLGNRALPASAHKILLQHREHAIAMHGPDLYLHLI